MGFLRLKSIEKTQAQTLRTLLLNSHLILIKFKIKMNQFMKK